MPGAKILVLENEGIVASSLKRSLEGLGMLCRGDTDNVLVHDGVLDEGTNYIHIHKPFRWKYWLKKSVKF